MFNKYTARHTGRCGGGVVCAVGCRMERRLESYWGHLCGTRGSGARCAAEYPHLPVRNPNPHTLCLGWSLWEGVGSRRATRGQTRFIKAHKTQRPNPSIVHDAGRNTFPTHETITDLWFGLRVPCRDLLWCDGNGAQPAGGSVQCDSGIQAWAASARAVRQDDAYWWLGVVRGEYEVVFFISKRKA